MTVDPALRKYPGLFEDSLAEGKRWAERNRAEAAKASRDEPVFFREGRRWTFESVFRTCARWSAATSACCATTAPIPAARIPIRMPIPSCGIATRASASNIRPFFRETADNGPTMTALAQLARLAVAAEKLSRDAINVDVPKEKLTPEQLAKLDSFISDGIQPSLLKIGPISLAPSTEAGKSSGLTFHYSPYMVGAYAEGPYTVFVPWTAFRSHLSPQGAAIFGGQRPESDNIQ